jgi:2-dehydropantoate 2-reductase
MRVLVVGAGSIGGYFGGRLLAAGREVTFLVRPQRAAQLAQTGLLIRSPHGDLDLLTPPTITVETLSTVGEPFDLILLSVKAYSLDAAIDSFAPVVAPHTRILPLLNGMRHLESLEARFSANQVLGGLAMISTMLDAQGRILHLGEVDNLVFGPRDSAQSEQIEAISTTLVGAGFAARLSDTIMQEMWEKWVFIATCAGITCLMRAAIGDLIAAGAGDMAITLLGECAAIATAAGVAPGAAALERSRSLLTAPGSSLTASMLRDIEHGSPIEADHIIGDLLHRSAEQGRDKLMLRTVYAHLKSYEARRAHEMGQVGS